jgi:hypothetical protein
MLGQATYGEQVFDEPTVGPVGEKLSIGTDASPWQEGGLLEHESNLVSGT